MKAIVCMNPSNGIGYQNEIPWKSKIDMKHFKDITTGNGKNAVVMGFNTFKSIGYRPLSNRKNIVITSRSSEMEKLYTGVTFESKIENVFHLTTKCNDVFVIGGQSIYELFSPFIDEVYVTLIHWYGPIDTFFLMNLSSYNKELLKKETENEIEVIFYKFKKK